MAKVFSVRPRDSGVRTPGQVQGLNAAANGQSEIDLTWAPLSGAFSYTLRRGGVAIQTGITGTSYADTGLAASTHYSYTVSALNTFGEGTQSAAASATTAAAPDKPTGAISWNPSSGLLSLDVMYPGIPGYSSSYITGLPSKQWQQLVAWNALSDGQGSYTFDQLTTLYNLCAANGKRLVIQIMVSSFTDGTPMRLPTYLSTLPGGGGGWYNKPTGGLIANLWNPVIMDEVIALDHALGLWAAGKPFFEGVISSESDNGFSTIPPGYATFPSFAAAWMGQLERRLDTVAANYPTKNFWQETNFIPTNQSAMRPFVEYIYQSRAGISSPDTKAGSVNGHANYSWGQHVVHGDDWNGLAWIADGGKSYVGLMPIAGNFESPDFGGKTGHPSASQAQDQAHNWEDQNHTWWCRKTGPEGTSQQLYYDNTTVSTSLDPPAGRWSPDIKTFMTAGSAITWSTVPSNYPAVITGET